MSIMKYLNGGKYFDDNARLDVITYVTYPNKIKHGYTNAAGFEPSYLAGLMTAHAQKYGKDSGVRLRHFFIAFTRQELSSAKKAYEIAVKIGHMLGCNYQTVYAVHEDKFYLHIHFVHNSVGYNGERFKGTYSESHALENSIKSILKPYGIRLMVLSSNEDFVIDVDEW